MSISQLGSEPYFFCTSCQTSNSSDSDFCRRCGAALTVAGRRRIITIAKSKFQDYSWKFKIKARQMLWKCQIEALDAIVSHYVEKEDNLAIISMPSGTGKSGIIACVPYWLEIKNMLVITPSSAIKKQLMVNLGGKSLEKSFYYERGIMDLETAKKFGPAILVPDGNRLHSGLATSEVVLANPQLFDKNKPWVNNICAKDFDLVVVDEAHHHPAPMWKSIIDHFKNNARMLFLTSTPYRLDGQVVVQNPLTYALTVADAIDQGLIRRLKKEIVRPSNGSSSKDKCDCRGSRRVEGRCSECHIKLKDLKIYRDSLKGLDGCLEKIQKRHASQKPANWKPQAIAVASTVAAADRIAKLATGMGLKSESYHSLLTKERHDTTLKDFVNQKLRLIVVVGQLLEGFSHSNIFVAILFRTEQPDGIRFSQLVGRALRRIEGEEPVGCKAYVMWHEDYDNSEAWEKYQSQMQTVKHETPRKRKSRKGANVDKSSQKLKKHKTKKPKKTKKTKGAQPNISLPLPPLEGGSEDEMPDGLPSSGLDNQLRRMQERFSDDAEVLKKHKGASNSVFDLLQQYSDNETDDSADMSDLDDQRSSNNRRSSPVGKSHVRSSRSSSVQVPVASSSKPNLQLAAQLAIQQPMRESLHSPVTPSARVGRMPKSEPEQVSATPSKLRGRVKFVSPDKGYRFIAGYAGQDIYAPRREVANTNGLVEGDEVEYAVRKDNTGRYYAADIAIRQVQRLRGRVKYYWMDKGYGFITGNDGKDIFAYKSQVMNANGLKEGHEVEYIIEKCKNGRDQAVSITGVNGATLPEVSVHSRISFADGSVSSDIVPKSPIITTPSPRDTESVRDASSSSFRVVKQETSTRNGIQLIALDSSSDEEKEDLQPSVIKREFAPEIVVPKIRAKVVASNIKQEAKPHAASYEGKERAGKETGEIGEGGGAKASNSSNFSVLNRSEDGEVSLISSDSSRDSESDSGDSDSDSGDSESDSDSDSVDSDSNSGNPGPGEYISEEGVIKFENEAGAVSGVTDGRIIGATSFYSSPLGFTKPPEMAEPELKMKAENLFSDLQKLDPSVAISDYFDQGSQTWDLDGTKDDIKICRAEMQTTTATATATDAAGQASSKPRIFRTSGQTLANSSSKSPMHSPATRDNTEPPASGTTSSASGTTSSASGTTSSASGTVSSTIATASSASETASSASGTAPSASGTGVRFSVHPESDFHRNVPNSAKRKALLLSETPRKRIKTLKEGTCQDNKSNTAMTQPLPPSSQEMTSVSSNHPPIGRQNSSRPSLSSPQNTTLHNSQISSQLTDLVPVSTPSRSDIIDLSGDSQPSGGYSLCGSCKTQKHRTAFANIQWMNHSEHHRICSACVMRLEGTQEGILCSLCNELKSLKSFPSQHKHRKHVSNRGRVCLLCTARRYLCCICKEKKTKGYFENFDLGKARVCRLCSAKDCVKCRLCKSSKNPEAFSSKQRRLVSKIRICINCEPPPSPPVIIKQTGSNNAPTSNKSIEKCTKSPQNVSKKAPKNVHQKKRKSRTNRRTENRSKSIKTGAKKSPSHTPTSKKKKQRQTAPRTSRNGFQSPMTCTKSSNASLCHLQKQLEPSARRFHEVGLSDIQHSASFADNSRNSKKWERDC